MSWDADIERKETMRVVFYSFIGCMAVIGFVVVILKALEIL